MVVGSCWWMAGVQFGEVKATDVRCTNMDGGLRQRPADINILQVEALVLAVVASLLYRFLMGDQSTLSKAPENLARWTPPSITSPESRQALRLHKQAYKVRNKQAHLAVDLHPEVDAKHLAVLPLFECAFRAALDGLCRVNSST
ncbi:hypothetical protein PoMZ_09413, partial [Pyricularia oryzae]